MKCSCITMSGFVSGNDGTPLVGFEGAIVLQVAREVTQWGCRGCYSRHAHRAELQITLYLCSPCRTVTTLRLYGKSIAQYMNLSRIGCSKSFSDLHSNFWLKEPTRRAIKLRMRKSTCPWRISRPNTQITGAPSSARLSKPSSPCVVDHTL